MEESGKIIILVVLVLLSGFFSASEMSLFSLSPAAVRAMIKQHKKNAHLVEQLRSRPERLLITILIGNNIVNIAASSLATVVAIDELGSIGAGVATGVMTFIILYFGEIIPKTFSQRFNTNIARTIAPSMRVIQWVLAPIAMVFHVLTAVVQRMLGVKDSKAVVSEEEVKALVSMSHESGQVEKGELDLIEKVFLLNDTRVKDIMTPRDQMASLHTHTTLGEAMKVMQEAEYSRLPIFSSDESSVVGILHVKDVIRYITDNNGLDTASRHGELLNTRVEELMGAAPMASPMALVDDVLRLFQRTGTHMAVVADDDGDIHGLVTIEDALEELVGEIFDETDDEHLVT